MNRWVVVALGSLAIIAALSLVIFLAFRDAPQEPDKRGPNHAQPSSDASPTHAHHEPSVPPADTPSPTTQGSKKSVWQGPDDAVSSWFSPACGREVLSFGVQQYEPGIVVPRVPEGVEDMGYRLGPRQLWGDRGAPRTLYETTDGSSFQEWVAVPQECAP